MDSRAHFPFTYSKIRGNIRRICHFYQDSNPFVISAIFVEIFMISGTMCKDNSSEWIQNLGGLEAMEKLIITKILCPFANIRGKIIHSQTFAEYTL